MAAQPPAQANIVVPEEIRARFPDIIDLILGSESMNDEERQYWVNILPIMTPEQVQNLRDILQNEKKQLQEIDRKYAGTLSAEDQRALIAKTEEERKKKRMERQDTEHTAETVEEKKTEDLLEQIDRL